MTQGDPSTCVHFILEGQVRVERKRRSDAESIQLAVLGSGEIVGEMGVMVDLPRSATVIAALPTTTLELDTASFERVPDPPSRAGEAAERTVAPNLRAGDGPPQGVGGLRSQIATSSLGPEADLSALLRRGPLECSQRGQDVLQDGVVDTDPLLDPVDPLSKRGRLAQSVPQLHERTHDQDVHGDRPLAPEHA
jgi:hypothetical protein